MSTPFPLEEQAASDAVSGPMSDPWHGPTKPGFFSGFGYNEENAYLGPSTPILSGVASAASKAVAGAAGAASSLYGAEASLSDNLASAVGLTPDPEKNPLRLLSEDLAATQAAAQKNVDALMPNATTTGAAFQIVHGVSEGASLAVAGAAAGGLPGAVALTSTTEASGTYQESLKAGLSPEVAAARAAVSGVASGAGVLIPGGFGSTLATRLLTGTASNVSLGFASRYADHKILEANGYLEMAAQQKVWDTTAVLTDALLGAAFGGIAHLHGHEAAAVTAAAKEPGMVDAALVTNLAVQDRNLAVGVPVDSTATHAHADALEVSNQQLLEGKPNDVSQTGVNEAKFASRPVDEARQAEAQGIAREYMPERSAADILGVSGEPAANRRQVLAIKDDVIHYSDGTSEPVPEAMRQQPWTEADQLGTSRDSAANEPYRPADTEITEAGGKPSAENADRVALIARAAEIDPARIEALTSEHVGDSNAFIEAARQVIDEHAAAAQRGEGGTGAPRPAAGAGERGVAERAGSARSPTVAEPAGSRAGSAAAASAAGTERGATGAPGADSRHAVDPLTAKVQEALQERPTLEVTNEEGKPTRAADLLRQVQEDAARETTDFQKAVTAAINCFGRRGS